MSMHSCGFFLMTGQKHGFPLWYSLSLSPWSPHLFQLWVPRLLSVHQFLLLHLSTFFFSLDSMLAILVCDQQVVVV